MSEAANRIVGDILRDIRLDMGMSQSQVAERCGVRQPFISKVEHGERELSAVEILPYAAALGISDERLYHEIHKALITYAREVRAARRNT